MTIRKRPSLRENIPGGDDTARQLEQAESLEQLRRGDAASTASAAAPEPAAPPPEAPPVAPPVAALAHAYMHGPSDAPPVRSSGRGLTAVATVLTVLAVGTLAGAGALWWGEQRGGAPGDLLNRIGALEITLGTTTGGKLSDRVAALEASVAQVTGSSQVVGILAARQLRGALADSAPFVNELALVRLAGVADADTAKALDRIAGRAAVGIPTRNELNGRFAVLVPTVLNAELGTGSNGIGETMWGWVTGVANVLRLPASETVVESKAAELLTRAGMMLEAGDLSGALERVSLLEGPSAEAAKPWMEDVGARIAADQAATLLSNRVTAMLAAGKR
ncbi:COG4223 family protein [Azospirillum sp. sgz301742]